MKQDDLLMIFGGASLLFGVIIGLTRYDIFDMVFFGMAIGFLSSILVLNILQSKGMEK